MYATTQPQAATSVLAVQSCTVCHSYMYTDCSIGLILLCAHTHLAMSLGMHPVLKTARDATALPSLIQDFLQRYDNTPPPVNTRE